MNNIIDNFINGISNINGGKYNIKISEVFKRYSYEYKYPYETGGIYIINQGSNDYNYNKSNICKIGSASRNNTLLDRLDSYGTYYPFGFIVNILLIPKYNINDYNHIKELMYSKFIKNEEITNDIDIILCELLKKHTLGINKTNNENYKSFIDCLILFTEEYIHSLLIKTKKI
jgi:hypothetical protein